MPFAEQFAAFKALDTNEMDISLAIVKEYKVNRQSRYIIEYVLTNQNLKLRLGGIVRRKIDEAAVIDEYTYDSAEPDPDQFRVINIAETDFLQIKDNLTGLLPAEHQVENVNELVKAKAYMIIFRNQEGIQLVGYKTIPENWKLKREKGYIPLVWRGNRFEDLEDENVFSIANTVDFISFDETLFINSKRGFETAMNFRAGMMDRANELYDEIHDLHLFSNLPLLTNRVGNNQRYLRKIAIVKNLGYYRDVAYLRRLRELSAEHRWDVQFDGDQIVLSEQNIDEVLTLLQNKRLHSLITDEFFDVDAARLYQRNQ